MKIFFIYIVVIVILSGILLAEDKPLFFETEIYNYSTSKYEKQEVFIDTKSPTINKVLYIKIKNSGKFGFNLLSELKSHIGFKNIELGEITPIYRSNVNNTIIANKNKLSNIYRISYNADISPIEAVKLLKQNDNIEYAVPLYRRYLREFIPNDEHWADSWHLAAIEMSKAWDISKGDSNIIIGIVDSGTDSFHEDLNANCFININETPGDNIDNDENGFIDDVRGWDFIGDLTFYEAVDGKFKPDNITKPAYTSNDHGTAVAGTASMVTNNNVGGASPAFRCKFLPIKCATDNLSIPNGYSDILIGFEGIIYAAQMGAKIINLSWGGPGYSIAEKEIIDALIHDYGVVIVAAGDNYPKNSDLNIDYPIGYGNVIGVSSIDKEDNLDQSAFGTSICVFAPGRGIVGPMNGGEYSKVSGTSFSTPIVSSVLALLKSEHKDWTWKELYHQLRSSATPFDSVKNENRYLWYGKLNAFNALNINNDKIFNSPKLPGLEISKIFNSQKIDTIKQPGSNEISLVIKNYLEKATNISIRLTPMSPHLEIVKPILYLNEIDQKSETEISTIIKLKETNPWYYGKYKILAEFWADDEYYNSQIFEFYIDMPTKNKFFIARDFDSKNYPRWISSSVSMNTLFVAGYFVDAEEGVVYINSSEGKAIYTKQEIPSTIIGLDYQTGIVGTLGTEFSPAKIFFVNSSGEVYKKTDVSDISRSVYKIHFYDKNNGFFLGKTDSKNIWNIGKTNNGGETWQKTQLTIQPDTDDLEFWTSYHADNSGITAFGTYAGKIIVSFDSLKTWQSQSIGNEAILQLINFKDNQNGVAIYIDKNDISICKAAYTTDGGKKWTKGNFNFFAWGFKPIYLFSVSNSDEYYMLCSKGEQLRSHDGGKTWEPILNWEYQEMMAGYGESVNNNIRIWQLGFDFCFSSFKPFSNEKKAGYDVVPDKIDFGTIENDSSSIRSFKIKNLSENELQIYNIEDNSGLIKLQNSYPTVINGDSECIIDIIAVSDKSNSYKTEIDISTSADEEKKLFVEANFDLTNISGNGNYDNIMIYPNPTSGILNIITTKDRLINEIRLYSFTGELLNSIHDVNNTKFLINFVNSANGMYILECQMSDNTIIRKIVNKATTGK